MDKAKLKHGMYCWTDITIEDAAAVKDFYKTLFNWTEMPVNMKEGDDVYVDYAMAVDESTPGGGICNNRGSNMGMPPQWISYFYVNDVAKSLADCIHLGGKLIKGNQKPDGQYNYVIVSDPQGHVFGMVNM